MAEEKKEAASKKAAPKKAAAKKEAPAKKEAAPKEAAKKEPAKKEEAKPKFPAPNEHDYDVVLEPIITEKSMALLQNSNKVTVKVSDKANKIEIKRSFERLYGVKVLSVTVLNQRPKATTRGTRYKGTISGYKKAVVTLAEGEAIDLFKE